MLNRRQFLKTVAVGAVATRTPAATRLKATGIDHISYQSVDYKKTRDFYVDLLGFQVSDEDNQQLYLWAGDMIISAKNTPRVMAPLMDHFGFTVEPWDHGTVVAALKERGLSASINRGNDPHDPPGKSVFTRDASGYPAQLCAPDLETRPAPVASRVPLKAIGLHHISYQCPDYRKSRDFYAELVGARVSNDDGRQAYLWFGNAYLVVQSKATVGMRPVIDHVAWTVADWNRDRVVAELKRRGLDAQPDASGKTVLTKDLNGYPFELCDRSA